MLGDGDDELDVEGTADRVDDGDSDADTTIVTVTEGVPVGGIDSDSFAVDEGVGAGVFVSDMPMDADAVDVRLMDAVCDTLAPGV